VFWINEGKNNSSIRQPSPEVVLIVIAVLDYLETIMDSLGTAATQFLFDLFKELNKTNDGNVFFSPVGISTAIGMIILGTRGATASELQKVGSFLSCPERGLVLRFTL
jgi:serine protease inhibitor